MPTRRPKRSKDAAGAIWRRTVKYVVQRDAGICWICHHAAAKSADHIIPDTEGGSSRPDNLKAVHSVGSPCPECSRAAGKPIYCNEIRSFGSVERARRRISDRTGLTLDGPRAAESEPEGREWLSAYEMPVGEVRGQYIARRVQQDDAHMLDEFLFTDASAFLKGLSVALFVEVEANTVLVVDTNLVLPH